MAVIWSKKLLEIENVLVIYLWCAIVRFVVSYINTPTWPATRYFFSIPGPILKNPTRWALIVFKVLASS